MGNSVIKLTLALMLSLPVVAQTQAQDFDSFAPGNREALHFRDESHASSRQNVDMLRLAHDSPDKFVNKLMVLNDGRKAGNILSIQRNREDKLLYLIIQAEPYFKSKILFAVPVLDVTRITDQLVILTTLPGGFLRGMEYEAADFQDVGTYEDWPLVVDD